MGLRYVPDFRVLVAAVAVDPDGAAAIAEAAGYAGASLVVVTAPGRDIEPAIPGAIVLEAPAADPDGAFARLVARLAVALDKGGDPAIAFATAVAAGGWDRIERDQG